MLLVIDKVPPPLPQQHFPLSPFHPSHTFTQTHDRPQLVYTMYKSPPSRSSSPIPHPPLQSLPPTITKIRMMNVPPLPTIPPTHQYHTETIKQDYTSSSHKLHEEQNAGIPFPDWSLWKRGSMLQCVRLFSVYLLFHHFCIIMNL